MGNAGSGRARPASPSHEAPQNRAPKVLPDLDENPRLRSTDNGVILQSGGTISGRRPQRATQGHPGVYRSRSASSGETPSGAEESTRGAGCAGAGVRRDPALRRERDPLHRSQNHLDQALATPGGFALQVRGFGSEPDLRNEAEKPKLKTNKHFRKKYKAPAPPANHMGDRDGSSPDSYEGHPRAPPARKLRLFKTRSETKKISYGSELTDKFSCNDTLDVKIPKEEKYEPGYTDRRFRSPSRYHYLQYPVKGRDMIQSPSSLRREENIFQASLVKEELRKNKTDKYNGYKPKGQKIDERYEVRRTPHLDRNFRHSERFKKQVSEHCELRREKSFDASFNMRDKSIESGFDVYSDRRSYLAEQYKRQSNESPMLFTNSFQRSSLPSLLHTGNDKNEFQEELKKATSRIRNDHMQKTCVEESQRSGIDKTSQNSSSNNNFKNEKCKISLSKNTMYQSKLKDKSSRENKIDDKKEVPTERNSKIKEFELQQACPQMPLGADDRYKKMESKITGKHESSDASENISSRRESRGLADRGQASGKESTPEQSPNRLNDADKPWDREAQLPSKQFYFGMINTNEVKIPEAIKEFPGLGAPINGDFNNYHLIEKKLLNYKEEESDIDKFTNKVQNTARNGRTISSESALSSEPEVEENSEENNPHGIALMLRPTLPKKQLEIPRFSPAAAWRQLAAMEANRDSSPLAQTEALLASVPVATTVGSVQHDRSGDSGISGDAPHDVPRIDSPTLLSKHALPVQWTPEQDLDGDSSSDAAPEPPRHPPASRAHVVLASPVAPAAARFHARNQLFSLSLPRETHLVHSAEKVLDNISRLPVPESLQKLRKSVSGALGAALGARKYEADLEDEEDEVNQNWFLSKSAPNSLTHGLLHQNFHRINKTDEGEHNGEETTPLASDQEDQVPVDVPSILGKQPAFSYLSSGGHVMYLPQYDAKVSRDQPYSLHAPDYRSKEGLRPWRDERLLRTKSSGEIELKSRRSKTSEQLEEEMRERRPSSPPPHLRPYTKSSDTKVTSAISSAAGASSRRFAFQSPARQLERRRVAERLARDAELRERRRRAELEAMRRVEEEFQRKRAREKASIRQQLRLVGGHSSLPPLAALHQLRDEPDGAVSSSESPPPTSPRTPTSACNPTDPQASRASPRPASAASGIDKSRATSSSERTTKSSSTTAPATRVLSEWRVSNGARQYRDWSAGPAPRVHPAHPPACYRMPKGPHAVYATTNGHAGGVDAVDGYVNGSGGGCSGGGSPRSDDYRREFARGSAASSSGSELSARRTTSHEETREKSDVGVRMSDPARTEAAIIPTGLKAPPPLLKIR